MSSLPTFSKGSLALLLAASAAFAAAPPLPKLLDATVVVNQVEIPFRFGLSQRGETVSGFFFNGEERVHATGGQFREGELTLEFAHYATKLVAKWDGTQLVGTYGRKATATRQPYPFRAKAHSAEETSSAPVPSIAGLWEIPVKSPKGELAWKLFVRQSGPEVSASILRVDGDTGTLTGSYRAGKFLLSHFSGARPQLLEVTLQEDGTLQLLQNAKTPYTAIRSNLARAKGLPEPADPSRWTSVANPLETFRFSGKTLTGETITEADPRFQGKVLLVNISGSWCPNCHDEAPFLAELYRKYQRQGLEIVSLSFEEAEQLENPVRLKAFIANYGLRYTVLLGGEPEELKTRLPQAVNLNTWPATFFIGRDGLVRGAHAGFASKATGEEHLRLKAEFEATVRRLLQEQTRSSR